MSAMSGEGVQPGPRAAAGSGGLLTIAVPACNRREELARCLRSCEERAPGCGVLVLDDGSTDGTASMLEREFPHVARVRFETNRGPAAARNAAFEAAVASTPYVAFLDSDVVLAPGWYEAVLGALAPDTVLAGCVEQPDGTVEHGPRRTMPWGGSLPCSPERANVASSANMVVPVGPARAIGGFFEGLDIYFEDSFFCITALRAGYKVRYVDGARVVHYHDSRLHPARKRRFIRNRSFAMTGSSGRPLVMAVLQMAVTAVDAAGALCAGRRDVARACMAGLVEGLRDSVAARGAMSRFRGLWRDLS